MEETVIGDSARPYRSRWLVALAAMVCMVMALAAPTAEAEFGLESLSVGYLDENGDPVTRAGEHPDEFVIDLQMNEKEVTVPDGSLKQVITELPLGFIGDPTAVSICREEQHQDAACPPGSQVGWSRVEGQIGQEAGSPIQFFEQPIYNLEPQPGLPVRLGFEVVGFGQVRVNARAKSEGDYRVVATTDEIPEGLAVVGTTLHFWGVPGDPSHDERRGLYCNGDETETRCPIEGGYPAGIEVKPFLSTPTSCDEPLVTTVKVASWQAPSVLKTYTATQPPMTDCDELSLKPNLNIELTHRVADTPTGLDVTLDTPQNLSPGGRASAHLKDITVTLPEGTTLNPPAADGQEACTIAQLHLGTLQSPQCPNPAKVGTVEIETPLLPETAKGSVYLAQPDDPATAAPGAENPFDSLVAIWMVVEAPGVILRVPGEVELDQSTGRVTTTFANNPQLPFETLRMRFFGGPRAALASPPICGTVSSEADVFTWAAPGSAIHKSDPYEVNQGPNGTPCSTGLGARPFAPDFDSGSVVPLAGASSPFMARLVRADGQQEIKRIDVDPPRGLLAKLAGVPYCPEAAIDAIDDPSRTGRAELASSLCPAASQIGTVSVAAGAGSSPYFVPGKVYLAGPYKGAELSFAVVTPAVTGPFDVGNVVVRTAVDIDRDDAEVHVVSDQLPHIIRGIPLRLRDVRVRLDRPDFVLNPTSCEPLSVVGNAAGGGGNLFSPADDVFARFSNPFRVGACGALGFRPKIGIRLFGGTKRGGHPKLRAVMTARRGDANIAGATVLLPRSVFLDQAHIRTVCTRVQYAASQCPPGSIYGYARAFTPLLDSPVYLRSSDDRLPNLVADLDGQVRIDLVARIDSLKGRIRTVFASVPDAPVSKFVLTMRGGKKGLAQNSRNLCARAAFARIGMRAHNGRRASLAPKVAPAGCRKARKSGRGRR
jgi:hypothetical protein